jgi:hypothetical protein
MILKTIVLAAALLAGTSVFAQGVAQKVEIVLTKTTPYCGGANPPAEILEEASKQKIPFGEKFYLIKGAQNTVKRRIIKAFTYDSSGVYTLRLPAGTYSIINAFGFNKVSTDKNRFDINCLQQLWKKPVYTFTVTAGKSNLFSSNITELCPYNVPCSKEKMAMPM